jgi:sulfur carrier protein
VTIIRVAAHRRQEMRTTTRRPKAVAAAKTRVAYQTEAPVVKVRSNDYQSVMRLVLNGEARECRAGVTVAELVTELGLGERRIAVEVNRDILPREAYAHALSDGDEVEIVHFIGGG